MAKVKKRKGQAKFISFMKFVYTTI